MTERKGLIIQLIGYPGVGKYTIAQEIVAQLVARGEVARLIDNHLTANLITDLVADPYVDGVLIDAARERIAQVRSILERTLEEVSPPDWTFVFTNFPMIGYPHEAIFRNRELAHRRGSTFLPILLSCQFDELMRRVESPLRTGKHKLRDPRTASQLYDRGVFVPDLPELRTIDVTHLAAGEAARAILELRGDPEA